MLNHKRLAKDHLGQVLSQPCCQQKKQILIEDVLQTVKKSNKKASNQRQVE